MDIYIVGAGTLGMLIVEIVESLGQYKVGGFFDDNFPTERRVLDYEILGKLSDIDLDCSSSLAIGVGEPRWRRSFFEEMSKRGFKFPSLIHESSLVSRHSIVEDGVIVGPQSSVLGGSIVERGGCILSHVNINQGVKIGPFCLIGAGSTIGNSASLGEGCHLGLSSIVKLGQEIPSWSYFTQYE